MCKIDLKGAYFIVPLDKSCRHLVRFLWEGNLYEFLCQCFDLGPVPRDFTKILKVPISLLRRLNIRILIYLDDMLLMSQLIERLLVARDTVIFLLQHLGYVINFKKSVMELVQTIEYLGLLLNSIQMSLSLTEEKVKGILQECNIIFSMKEITVFQLTQLVGLLSSTIQAVLPAQIQFRYLQIQQVSALKGEKSYKKKIILNDQALGELQWWIENLTYFSGRYLIQAKPQMVIQTHTSPECWGANCMGTETGGKWSIEERKLHIELELLAMKNAILVFTKEKTINVIHIQTDNTTALSYLLKMGVTTDKTLVDISKDIWKYLILKHITVTAEYLPSILNTRADWQSRHSKDFSEWKLSPIVFQHICQKMGMPVLDLFASRLSNQIAKYFAWKPDPHSIATDTMQQEWNQEILYAFSSISLIPRVLCKIAEEKVSTVIMRTTAWKL